MRNAFRAAQWALAAAVLVALGAQAAPPDARRRKKLIAIGWDQPNSERLLANHMAMQRRPFDGVVARLEGRVDKTKRCPLHWAFLNRKWRREWFQPCVRNLKACKLTRFTDNFILFGANPGDVDWFDDGGWREIVDHWRIAAWAARQAGFKGLGFDPEPYAPPHAAFKYAAQPRRDKHTFAEYCAQVRRRGREVMKAVCDEYPDVTLLCFFMNIAGATATGQADPRPALRPLTYGLYPAFIDGWLDVAPPGVKLVDGCEWSYLYNSTAQYLEAAALIRGACQELVSPANRAKYRAQVQVGYGMYLDAYWNAKDSEWGRWYVDGKGGPRVERLRINVQTALRVADEYVWVYGEKFRWWPTPNPRVKAEAWPDALPGCEKALRYARDPAGCARAQMAADRKAGKRTNLARNGGFSSAKAPPSELGPSADWRQGRPPAGWGAWQDQKSTGTFTWDRQAAAGKGAARAANVANGCFIQGCRVRPGERYAVRAVRRVQGGGTTWVRIRWQTPEGKWTAETQDRVFYAPGPGGEWGEIFGVVVVPESAGRLLILLGVGGQHGEGDAAWFDDVELHRIE